ncbi:hypothetical protein [Caenimonas koreensis]|uniref:DUF697 domain-containing protein n=1 Tax=Caenimonas koreensis DSM 17982 TaxID=1121255 RepID=A0A844BAL0_9BURK|nr:hypothetical protein [Caenimonas koreensis]MRD48497.1 hypothetical protein [Caenimonas koreensis DSM 17982]
MPTALQLAADHPILMDAVRRSRKILNRRAIAGAVAGAVPIPGLDWMVDAALLSRLMPAINAEFGLTPAQLDKLPAHKRVQADKAIATVGSVLIGKFVTRDLVMRMAQHMGKRITVKQASKYVPIAGQAVSAMMSYAAIRYLGEEHIKDCVRVALKADLMLPAHG